MTPVLEIIINHYFTGILIILQVQYCLEHPINSTHYYITIWAYQCNYFHFPVLLNQTHYTNLYVKHFTIIEASIMLKHTKIKFSVWAAQAFKNVEVLSVKTFLFKDKMCRIIKTSKY